MSELERGPQGIQGPPGIQGERGSAMPREDYIERPEFTELCRRVDNHLEHLDESMDGINAKVSKMEGGLATLKWMLGIGLTFISVAVAVIGIILAISRG